MSSNEAPRTPLVLVVMALLVVGGVYFVYDESRSGQMRDLDAWASTPLSREEIRGRLADEAADADDLGHALIQLELLANGASADGLSALVDFLPAVYERGDDRVRQLTLFTARAFRGDDIVRLLGRALGDDVAAVRLEAAVGLAAFRDRRAAPLLADAIDAVRPDHALRRRELLRAYSLVAIAEHESRINEWLRVARIDDDADAVQHCEAALRALAESDDEPGR
jgi:hypothetical protein